METNSRSNRHIAVPYGLNDHIISEYSLSEIPHLFISGTTGSGKTSYIRSAVAKMMRDYSRDELQFLICDSKQVDYPEFNIAASMLVPVVSNADHVAAALEWLYAETTDRLRQGYELKNKPEIICIIDDFGVFGLAENYLGLISHLLIDGRRTKVHLWIVTSTPMKSVIPYPIYASLPFRMTFRATSSEVSRAIIGASGAEYLRMPGEIIFKGLHGLEQCDAFMMDDEEIMEVCKGHWRDSSDYEIELSSSNSGFDDEDELLLDAIETVVDAGQASVSMLQRRFRIGYSRATRLIDTLEVQGIIGPADGSRPRQVLMSEEEFRLMKEHLL